MCFKTAVLYKNFDNQKVSTALNLTGLIKVGVFKTYIFRYIELSLYSLRIWVLSPTIYL